MSEHNFRLSVFQVFCGHYFLPRDRYFLKWTGWKELFAFSAFHDLLASWWWWKSFCFEDESFHVKIWNFTFSNPPSEVSNLLPSKPVNAPSWNGRNVSFHYTTHFSSSLPNRRSWANGCQTVLVCFWWKTFPTKNRPQNANVNLSFDSYYWICVFFSLCFIYGFKLRRDNPDWFWSFCRLTGWT